MTVLHPCLHCHRKADCQIKRDTHAKLLGTGITKANLRCKIPEQDFPPGARVIIDAFEIRAGEHNAYVDRDDRKCATKRTGVIRCWSGSKCWVVLDKGQEIRKLYDEDDKIGLLSATTDRLTRIGDDVVLLCACGLDAGRCANNDMPSTRTGKWSCPDKAPSWQEWI
jgi:hypothetical protein